MEDILVKAQTITTGVSLFPGGDDKSTARAESTARSGVGYTSKLVIIATSDCAVSTLNGLPCRHNVTHARFSGLDWAKFVDPMKTVADWNVQYPLGLHFPDAPNLAAGTCARPVSPTFEVAVCSTKKEG
ncbi:hypothetical protein CYMTET_10194 [Cymbomonas tetramitiformis]|uniref:Uncharacterized protein n=1 Tax=Cymbomonas tetramitiformis TaxID=36881 RepID=A0AAE0GPT6_9CHLO|nr:hypothetical protein CYMTET_10194 [Cymbomonas tetramitiformis]